jgi:serine/threonine-protein kinase HipA
VGRKSHSETLVLWANGVRVGRWTILPRGATQLAYDQAWLTSPLGRPLSLSLPFNLNNEPLQGEKVANYFDNLLPDSTAIRTRVATRFKTGSTDPFDLLRAVGRDCVGAIQLLKEAEEPAGLDKVEGVEVDDEAIERHLLEVVTPERFQSAKDPDDDFRISLAGAQEKDAFLWWEGKWYKPRGATPTTHIFKLPLGLVGGQKADLSTSVDNEWLCLKLLEAYGLPVAHARIATFGSQRVLVVERFDRIAADGRLLRLPQEDFCQATGTSPLMKYENEGGPGLSEIFSLLQQSVNAEADMRTLMASQILFWMLRAPDGHAKNFSIQLLSGAASRFQLTPMYDVVSAYPVIGNRANQWAEQDIKLAMALLGKNRHYHMHNIQRRHFNSTAKKVGYAQSAEPLIQEIIKRTPLVVEQVQRNLPQGFSQKVGDTVFAGLLNAAQALEAMPVGRRQLS